MAVSMRTQEIEMASDADINVSNTEITVGMQQDAMQGKKRGVVKVSKTIKNAGLPPWVTNVAVTEPLYSNSIIACILPCLASKLVTALFLIAVIVPSIVLIALNAIGPLQCRIGGFNLATSFTIAMIAVIPGFAVICVCWSCFVGKFNFNNAVHVALLRLCVTIGFFVCLALPTLVITCTLFVFVFPLDYRQASQNLDSCQFLEALGAAVVASYLFIALLCLSVTASCCYICKQKRNRNVPVCYCRTFNV